MISRIDWVGTRNLKNSALFTCVILAVLLTCLNPSMAALEDNTNGEAPIGTQGHVDAVQYTDACVPETVHNRIVKLIKLRSATLQIPSIPTTTLQLHTPVDADGDWDTPTFYAVTYYVDLMDGSGVRDYMCGTATYDGHHGTDYATWPLPLYQMDHDNVWVQAAAGGYLEDKHDGEYDRNCERGTREGNYVLLRHNNGAYTLYYHMKSGSITTKAIGSWISLGEQIGVVGSSGDSNGPHLHFELMDSQGNPKDPHTGSCNSDLSWGAFPTSSGVSPYKVPQVNQLFTHSAQPSLETCPTSETPRIKTSFNAGDRIVFSGHFSWIPAGSIADVRITDPSDHIVWSWTWSWSTEWPLSYWYTGNNYLPSDAETGRWHMEVTDRGGEFDYEISFDVLGAPIAEFTADPLAGEAPLAVQFTDQSNPGVSAISQWYWSFGDGDHSNLANPLHTYTLGGSYAVSLMVTNSVGTDTNTKSSYISVTIPTDVSPPLPDPLTWEVVPAATAPTAIEMTMATASDPSGPVQYEVEELTGNQGGADRTWNNDSYYHNTGLSPNSQYSYRARTRDSAPIPNVGGYTDTIAAWTLAETPPAPLVMNPTANSVQVDPEKGANPPATDLAIHNIQLDLWVDESGMVSSTVPVFMTDTEWGVVEIAALTSGTYYSFEVSARNADGVITDAGPIAGTTTLSTLTVITPNGGEVWTASSNETIVWNSSGSILSVNIEYSADGGITFSPVANAIPNTGSYADWTIPNEQSTDCLIRISNASDGIPSDESDEPFTILALPTFHNIAAGLPGVEWPSIDWGDYDNDGDLDILLTGKMSGSGGISRIYNNDDGNFTDIEAGLTGVYDSSVEWGDYDNDGDLDILLTGQYVSKVYRNDDGTFTDINAGLPGVTISSASWGDYDNDGDLDILLSGSLGSGDITEIYRNDDGNFFDAEAGLPAAGTSSAVWGDYDNDGDLDILLAGNGISGVYRNDAGIFTDIDAGLASVSEASAAWGDYDNDGDLDIILIGLQAGASITKLYRNNDGAFETVDAGIVGFDSGEVAWGDFDNDGDLDIILTGYHPPLALTLLYENDGGAFTYLTGTGLQSVWKSAVAWGDYDNDGDLDVILAGYPDGNYVTSVYRNDLDISNAPPASPGNPSATVFGTEATLKWDAATDSQTPSAGLSYNVRVGTTSGGSEIMASMANAANGQRGVVQLGNCNQSHSYHLSLPGPGTYYWSVQAIDGAYAGGPFSTEQTFEVVSPFVNVGASLPTVNWSTASYGDYDNDGDLDVLVTGFGGEANDFLSRIYRNNGSGDFTDMDVGLLGTSEGSTACGDYDGDGDLDLIITGSTATSGNVAKVYRNDDGTYTDIEAGLTGVSRSSVAFGDYDNDGDLDIILTGLAGSGGVSKLYRNDEGTFTDAGAGLPGVSESAVAWGDYDNDGDLDLLLTGHNGTLSITRIFRNDEGVFVNIDAGLPGVSESSVAWGDYDGDGDLDILLAGSADTDGMISKVYRNDSNTFSDIDAGLPGTVNSAVAWGDYDNDGNLDILLAGATYGATGITRVYRNNEGSFVDISAKLPGTIFDQGSAVWGDCDNDGDLDILLSGMWSTTAIYENKASIRNAAPTAPINLASSVLEHAVHLSWDAATDAQTPAQALSYNVRIGTSPEGNQISAGMADSASGYRRVVRLGNANHNLSWNVDPLGPGTYYWSVQAIDGAFKGGEFAEEQSFVVSTPLPFTDIAAGLPGMRYDAAAWGDYDNDGDLDILLAGNQGAGWVTQIYRNDGGVFSDIGAGLASVEHSAVAWGDYDGDGDLDLLLTGHLAETTISRVYRNDSGTFTDIAAGLPGISDGSVAWGDYDNDGDLDILLAGFGDLGSPISRIYRNDGGAFVDVAAGLPGVNRGSVAWGDYDNDGDLDILLGGDTGSGYITRVYRNDFGVFADTSSSLPGVFRCSSTWGDYDNDGDLDILLTGDTGSGYISRIYRNDSGAFSDIAAGLEGISFSSVAWGDYDNDGDLDVLLAGIDSEVLSWIYINDGADAFTRLNAGLPGVANGSVAWGDYDNDGDLDILLTGDTGPYLISRVYRSDSVPANTAPGAPTNLSQTLVGTSATLTWDAANDNQTTAAGLSYNLRIGTSPGGDQVSAAMADSTNGYRRVARLGNANHSLSWNVDLPGSGMYYWSVQAIDGAFAGGVFAPEQTLVVAQEKLAIEEVTPLRHHLNVDSASNITIQFSQSVSEADINAMPPIIRGGDGREVSYTVSDDGNGLVTLSPSNPFRPGERVSVEVLAGLAAGQAGATLEEGYQWAFWTSASATSMNFVPKLAFRGVQAFAVGAGDWDEDGTVDLAVAEYTPQGSKLKILLNDGLANFTLADSFITPANAVCLATADVDRDRHLDIILGHASSQQVSVWRGQGDGSFTGPESYVHGYQVNTMEVGDLDNDGYPDLVTANRADGTLTIFWNDGTGAFTLGADAPNAFDTRDISLGDWDLDGDLDIATASGADGHLIHTNLGGRNFIWGDESAGQDYDSWSVLLLPWLNHGDPRTLDFIGLSSGSDALLRSYVNAGAQFLKATAPYVPFWSEDEEHVGGYPDYPVLANIDGDASPDFLFVNYLEGATQVRLGYYYETYDIVVPVQNYPEAVSAPHQGLADIREPVTGDFDGNGSVDWTETFRQGGEVWVMLNDNPVAEDPVSLHELPVPLPAGTTSTWRSKIAIADDGSVHVIGYVDGYVMYGRYDGNSWLTENIGIGGSGVPYGHFDTFDLALGPDGTPHVVYVTSDGNLKYAVRGPSGWAIEDVGSGYGPSLAVSGTGEVVVVARDTGGMVAYEREGIWQPVFLGTSGGWEISTEVAFGASGDVHLALATSNMYVPGVQLRYWKRHNGSWFGEDVDEGAIGEGLYGIAEAPDGSPVIGYAALSGSWQETLRYAKLARKSNGVWNTEYVLRSVDNIGGFALDQSGQPAMLTGSHMLQMNGSRWTVSDLPGVSRIDDYTFDANGNIWASYSSGTFTVYTTAAPVEPTISLNDATAESGLPVDVHATSGVGWDDFDQDGWPDLFVARTDGPSEIYENNGDGTFTVASDPTLASHPDTYMGTSGDYDGNGLPDLYLVNPRGPNALLHTIPGLAFEDRTMPGLELPDSSWAGTWVDYDSDGLLDLHVCNLMGPDRLLKNMGASVFELQAGVLDNPAKSQYAAWADWDADGDQDLYLVTDSDEPNQLWRNDGEGSFFHVSSPVIESTSAGQGASWGDYDNDGMPDLFVTNWMAPSRLYHNLGNGNFEDATNVPMGETASGQAACWGDYDNDGDLDLYVAYYNAPNRLFRNDGESNGQWVFTSLYTNDPLVSDPGPTVGVATADYDKDGDLDLYLTNEGDSDRLLRNDQASGNHWLEIALENSLGGSFKGVHSGVMIGAKVRVVAGGIAQVREVYGTSGYGSQSWQVLHFGLGGNAAVDSVIVYWPQSGEDVVELVPHVDQIFPYSEKATPVSQISRRTVLHAARPNPFNPRTTISFDLAEAGRASLRIFDVSGRLVAILFDEQLTQGLHTKEWDGHDLHGRSVVSGVYFYQLKTESFTESKRMVLVK